MKLSRLPLSIFTDLRTTEFSPEDLRSAICSKLIGYGVWEAQRASINRNHNSTSSNNNAISTTNQLLQLTPSILLRALDPLLTYEECKVFLLRVCQHCSVKSQSALSLLRKIKNDSRRLLFRRCPDNQNETFGDCIHSISTGMEALDECLRGGFRIGSITEIVGNAGVGKTQLAMQLAVIAASLGFGSLFIDTERKISLSRFEQIAMEKYILRNKESGNDIREAADIRHRTLLSHHDFRFKHPNHVFENIILHSPASMSDLLSLVTNLEVELLLQRDINTANISSNGIDRYIRSSSSQEQKYPVRLVVIDSIAAPVLREYGINEAPQRTTTLFKIGQILKRLADQLDIAVILINQVRNESVQLPAAKRNSEVQSDCSRTIAALGDSWHHCVSTRLLLEYEQSQNFRRATVVKSNVSRSSSMLFEVHSSGLRQI